MSQDTPITAEKHSYGQILKSSALIGGSSFISIAIRIVHTKAMAVLLGPAGYGLMGVYDSIVQLAQSIAGLGINSSGVRQIAEAAGTGEKARIARTVMVLRRTAVILGTLGAVLLALFSGQVARLTFGTDERGPAVALLSFAVLFTLVSGGQGALIQGMRRISDLAKMGVLGTLMGTIGSITLVYFLRENGVVPALIGIAGMTLVISWRYSRKVQVEPVRMTVPEVRREAAGLLRLGVVFMASALLMMGAAYAVRTMVLRSIGLEAAGFYQAAWALGGLYVGFILQAMGADFYPRLTAVAANNRECSRLVNEQAQVSLLLAGPGVIATLTFASAIIMVFYSAKFVAAVEVLRWFCLGMALRVITWPMGYIILAKGASKFFFFTELAWTVVNVGLSWICLKAFGLNGTGIAFFGSYVFHGLMIYPVVRHLAGFRWTAPNIRTGLLFVFSIAVVFGGFCLLPPFPAASLGTLLVTLSGFHSIRTLKNLVAVERIPGPIRRLLALFGLAKPASGQ